MNFPAAQIGGERRRFCEHGEKVGSRRDVPSRQVLVEGRDCDDGVAVVFEQGREVGDLRGVPALDRSVRIDVGRIPGVISEPLHRPPEAACKWGVCTAVVNEGIDGFEAGRENLAVVALEASVCTVARTVVALESAGESSSVLARERELVEAGAGFGGGGAVHPHAHRGGHAPHGGAGREEEEEGEEEGEAGGGDRLRRWEGGWKGLAGEADGRLRVGGGRVG